jgi:hypothetical protein
MTTGPHDVNEDEGRSPIGAFVGLFFGVVFCVALLAALAFGLALLMTIVR